MSLASPTFSPLASPMVCPGPHPHSLDHYDLVLDSAASVATTAFCSPKLPSTRSPWYGISNPSHAKRLPARVPDFSLGSPRAFDSKRPHQEKHGIDSRFSVASTTAESDSEFWPASPLSVVRECTCEDAPEFTGRPPVRSLFVLDWDLTLFYSNYDRWKRMLKTSIERQCPAAAKLDRRDRDAAVEGLVSEGMRRVSDSAVRLLDAIEAASSGAEGVAACDVLLLTNGTFGWLDKCRQDGGAPALDWLASRLAYDGTEQSIPADRSRAYVVSAHAWAEQQEGGADENDTLLWKTRALQAWLAARSEDAYRSVTFIGDGQAEVLAANALREACAAGSVKASVHMLKLAEKPSGPLQMEEELDLLVSRGLVKLCSAAQSSSSSSSSVFAAAGEVGDVSLEFVSTLGSDAWSTGLQLPDLSKLPLPVDAVAAGGEASPRAVSGELSFAELNERCEALIRARAAAATAAS